MKKIYNTEAQKLVASLSNNLNKVCKDIIEVEKNLENIRFNAECLSSKISSDDIDQVIEDINDVQSDVESFQKKSR